MQNTQICTRLDGIRNRKSAAQNGGTGALITSRMDNWA